VIYFIEATGAGLLKIGFTDGDPEQRLKQLQTGCPHPLRLVATAAGSQKAEAELHRQFAHLRASGEWFRLDDELRVFVAVVRWVLPRLEKAEARLEGMSVLLEKLDCCLFPYEGDETTSVEELTERVDEAECNAGRLSGRVRGTEIDADDLSRRVLALEVRTTDDLTGQVESVQGSIGGLFRMIHAIEDRVGVLTAYHARTLRGEAVGVPVPAPDDGVTGRSRFADCRA
jgi:hypothetical protein